MHYVVYTIIVHTILVQNVGEYGECIAVLLTSAVAFCTTHCTTSLHC